jgi:hypothetical protein
MLREVTDTSTLRQGDIIKNVSFPLGRIEAIAYLGSLTESPDGNLAFEPTLEINSKTGSRWYNAQTLAAPSFCTVLSQCCEVDHSQSHPPPCFVLSRLVPVPDGLKKKPALYSSLCENVDPYGSARPFYPLFYVGAHAKFSEIEYVVDYGQSMSVRWADYSAVLARRVLQMDDITRAKFRVKAGAYFGRPTREEVDAGIADPWQLEHGSKQGGEPFVNRILRAGRVMLGKE